MGATTNQIATALYTTLKNNAKLTGTDTEQGQLGVTVYSGVAQRNAEYPFITIMPVDDVRRLLHQADPISFTTWDCKIWAKSMLSLGEIYNTVMDIFNAGNLSDDFIATLRGRGLPLQTEENRANEIIYSRVLECEIIV